MSFKCLNVVSFQAFLAHDSFGRVGSTRHQQVLLHQKSRWDTRPKQQVSHSIHCFALSFMLIVFSCVTAAQYCFFWSITSFLTGVTCSCWRTWCSRSTFWSGCCWECGAWSSRRSSTSSTWDAWTSVSSTATWRRLTQVSQTFCKRPWSNCLEMVFGEFQCCLQSFSSVFLRLVLLPWLFLTCNLAMFSLLLI